MTLRLAISVEGPTEYEFCREVMRPYLENFGVWIEPKIVVTKRNLAAPNATGGAVSIDRIVAEVTPLLHSFDFVTTLYDYYGFKDRQSGETVDNLCQRLSSRLGNPSNLIPYVQQYEFEALLFSAPERVGHYLRCPKLATAMAKAVSSCGSAEKINDHPTTAPSKRLEQAFVEHVGKRYDKTFFGPLLLIEIGLPEIRSACPRFDHWVGQLEQLTSNIRHQHSPPIVDR